MAANEFWGNNDSLWGGETFTSKENRSTLAIKKGDQFRIEKGTRDDITLIPHPRNAGTWNDSHSKTKPIKLTKVDDPGPNRRAFSMMVQTSTGADPQELFLVERMGGSIAIKKQLKGPGHDDNSCSVEN
jgi:hypothetical protein